MEVMLENPTLTIEEAKREAAAQIARIRDIDDTLASPRRLSHTRPAVSVESLAPTANR